MNAGNLVHGQSMNAATCCAKLVTWDSKVSMTNFWSIEKYPGNWSLKFFTFYFFKTIFSDHVYVLFILDPFHYFVHSIYFVDIGSIFKFGMKTLTSKNEGFST